MPVMASECVISVFYWRMQCVCVWFVSQFGVRARRYALYSGVGHTRSRR